MNIARFLRKSITNCNFLREKCLETNLSCSRSYCSTPVKEKLSVQSLVEEIAKLTRGSYYDRENNAEIVRLLRKHSLSDKDIIGHLSRSPKLYKVTASHFNEVIAQVKSLGLTLNQSMQLLEKNPDLVSVGNFDNIYGVVGELKSLGIVQKEIHAMLVKNPHMISAESAKVKHVYSKLKEYFTKAEAKTAMVKCPNMFTDDPDDIALKIHYAYDEMGISTNYIPRSELLQLPLKEIVARHKFLERLGRYKTANPMENVNNSIEGGNPDYKDIFKPNDKKFAREVALSTLEEYQTFRELFDYEKKQNIEDFIGSEDGKCYEDEEDDNCDEDDNDDDYHSDSDRTSRTD